jgi:membrane associated rhomboid family serine protease
VRYGVDPFGKTDPEGRRVFPWVTLVLAVLIVGGFAVEFAAGAGLLWGPSPAHAVELGANWGARTLNGEPWRLVTSMFLHYGILHLAMNLVVGAYLVGRFVERLYGHAAYLALYLVSGLAGGLASAAGGNAASLGASGAMLGLLGAVVAFLVVHRARMDPTARRMQLAGMAVTLGAIFVFSLVTDVIDFPAHAGGFAGGVVAGVALELRRFDGARRRLRAALVAVIGAALLVGATYVIPAQAPLARSSRVFNEHARTLRQRWIELWRAYNDDEVAAVALADVIETDLLPGLRRTRASYVAAGGGVQRTLDWIAGWDDGLTLVLAGLRADDTEAVRRGARRMIDADAAASARPPR